MTRPVVAVLLAGGLARRMGGGDKPLRLLHGRTLLDHVLDRVRPQVAAVALNANGDPARFAAWALPVVPDPLPDHPGPLAGVLAGMRWAQRAYPDVREILSVPTDTPFLPPDLVARLRVACDGHPSPQPSPARGEGAFFPLPLWEGAGGGVAPPRIAVAASAGRTHPVVALWPVALADALDAALRDGARKIDAWTAQYEVAVAAFDTASGDPFFNVNRAEDLATAEVRPATS